MRMIKAFFPILLLISCTTTRKLSDGNIRFTDPETGDVFEGEVKNGKPNGSGKMYSPSERETYVGQFKDGRREGKGKATYEASSIISYEGEWEDDQWNGAGAIAYANGEVRTGRFDEGKRDGSFILVDPKGETWAEVYDDDKRESIRKIESNEFSQGKVIEVEDGEGFIIDSFSEDSVLYKLGFRAGDRVIDIAGRRITRGEGSKGFTEIMTRVADGVNVMVLREGTEILLKLNLKKMADS